MKKLIKTIDYIIQKIRVTLKLKSLVIENAGIDKDGVAFVKLKDGLKFFGPLSTSKDLKYYKLLPIKVREKLPFESFLVAQDIIIRYFEGGLKLGGPKKESFYKVKKNDVVVEMGAFRGYYSMYLSSKVKADGLVIAIEPMPDNLFYLIKNIEENNISNIVVVSKGVWKEKSKLTFTRNISDSQSGSITLGYDNAEQLSIDVDSLDNIIDDIRDVNNIDHMTIQLNGVEVEALKGLRKYKPRNLSIAARYSNKGENSVEIIKEILEQRNYNVTISKKDYVFAEL